MAFFCWAYDASVNDVNFLVVHHVRQATCATCHSLDTSCCILDVGP
ncbi:hypothetical protein MUK42_32626 [Musa troglodytarum]|uniref:Uncharacterized protein n=1 Tax=Musa troglodytarum TaxID=320322 RepID=A0A9E7JS76_9LILI|nr:hypothetical protein MUK42_32626 [Musa troglodytarum]